MPGENELNRIRNAFRIPQSVNILAADAFKIAQNFSNVKGVAPIVPQGVPADVALTYRSLLNTPVYTNIEFLPGKYETNVRGVFKEFPYQRYDAVLITVTQPKIIVKTQIQGRDGSVKEYIGMDDYRIQVQGIITGTNGHYPIEDVYQLKKLTDAPIAIGVSCTFLNMLGINSMVVDEGGAEFAQEAGGYSYQTFSIPFISDVPQELRLTGV